MNKILYNIGLSDEVCTRLGLDKSIKIASINTSEILPNMLHITLYEEKYMVYKSDINLSFEIWDRSSFHKSAWDCIDRVFILNGLPSSYELAGRYVGNSNDISVSNIEIGKYIFNHNQASYSIKEVSAIVQRGRVTHFEIVADHIYNKKAHYNIGEVDINTNELLCATPNETIFNSPEVINAEMILTNGL